jgi:hypothetical protein
VGSGVNASYVCFDEDECPTNVVQPPQPVVPISGIVPTACRAKDLPVAAECDGTGTRVAYAFAAGAGCTPTVQTPACSADPGDGLRLLAGEAVVFLHLDLLGVAYSAGAAGFAIDGGDLGGCPNFGVLTPFLVQASGAAVLAP